jgi:hypothetical protein
MSERELTLHKPALSAQKGALTNSEFLSKLLGACKENNYRACRDIIATIVANSKDSNTAIENIIYLKNIINPAYQAISCSPHLKAKSVNFTLREYTILCDWFIERGLLNPCKAIASPTRFTL